MNKLPPGVEALTLPLVIVSADRPAFTVEQMHAAHAAGAQAGFLAGLDAAATVCDEASMSLDRHKWPSPHALAFAIRELKDKQ